MTGIEHLRKLASKHRIIEHYLTADTIDSIADQIERERACDEDAIENVRLIVGGVIDEMERHVLGHEGMEDSPVARWARELRAALGRHEDEEVEDVATIRKDAYDAYEWVEAHGGLDAVKEEWRSRVPRDRYERRRQCLLDHIAECETALGRRNQRIEELGHRVNDLTTENAELRRRAMPEGMEWPCFEDGEPVPLGGEVTVTVHDEDGDFDRTLAIRSIKYKESGVLLEGTKNEMVILSYGECVKRPAPKVLDADGEEIRVGDTVWDVEFGCEHVVTNVADGTAFVAFEDESADRCDPASLTHQRPVLDADGVPIRVGDTVYFTDGREQECNTVVHAKYDYKDEPYVQLGRLNEVGYPTYTNCSCIDPLQLTHRAPVLAADGRQLREGETVWSVDSGTRYTVEKITDELIPIKCRSEMGSTVSLHPSQLTHERPVADTWERLEEDATKLSPYYYARDVMGLDTDKMPPKESRRIDMMRDLVRRAKALAGRGE